MEYVASLHRAGERRFARQVASQATAEAARLSAHQGRRVDESFLKPVLQKIEKGGIAGEALDPVLTEIALAFASALVLDSGILLRRAEDGSFKVVARAGPAAAGLCTAVEQISPEARDIFGVSLALGSDILVSDVRMGNVARYIPVWLKLNSPIMSLILLPVVDSGVVRGLLFGLRCRGEALNLKASTLQDLKAIRAHLAALWRAGSKAK
jgi:GAF domain-containing protein